MGTYQEVVRRLQPIIGPLHTSLQQGISYAETLHGPEGFDRKIDLHFWAHTARRRAADLLREAGLNAEVEGQVSRLSAILVQYNNVWLRVLRPEIHKGRVRVPVPGRSATRQAFYRQDPVLEDLEGPAADNILLLWQDEAGMLREPMTLVRPTGGDHLRRNLTLDWMGDMELRMASLRAADLDALQPRVMYRQIGSDSA
ncbi:hypothetical protein ACFQ34_00645 [Pseudonocardia benzenivorans]|uniref:Uncharacterized protein n=1 Tax=Pseudonocardia benzenivorans TaxID=228005 RepID=A0ABW3V9L5_9PSEU